MASETLSVRIDSAEKEIICKYAEVLGYSVSEFMRRCALERIEDELDLADWHAAKAEYDSNPVSYSLEEVLNEFGIK